MQRRNHSAFGFARPYRDALAKRALRIGLWMKIVEDYEKRVLSSMVKKGATLEEKNQLAENLKISRATCTAS